MCRVKIGGAKSWGMVESMKGPFRPLPGLRNISPLVLIPDAATPARSCSTPMSTTHANSHLAHPIQMLTLHIFRPCLNPTARLHHYLIMLTFIIPSLRPNPPAAGLCSDG